MKHSFETYRARIGTHRGRGKPGIILNGYLIISFLCRVGILYWLFTLLLLSGDIERNPGPSNYINAFLLNTRSLKSVSKNHNKLKDFQSLVELKQAKIISVTESWLTEDIKNCEILPEADFNIYRKDRGGYGGVLTAIHTSIYSKLRPDLMVQNDRHNEIIIVEIIIPKLPRIALLTYYRPPSDNSVECPQNLETCLRRIREEGFSNILVMGDFNLPDFDLNLNVPLTDNNNYWYYYDIFQEFCLKHIVMCSTHQNGNRLDLILSTSPHLITDIDVEQDLFPSDHYLINFSIKASSLKNNKLTRSVFDYRNVDWTKVKAYLTNADLIDIVSDSVGIPDINRICDNWVSKLEETLNTFVPRRIIRDINSPPWIDSEVINLSKKKETASKRARRTNAQSAWAKYRRLRNSLRNMIDQKYNKYTKDSLDDIRTNPKRFWSFLRSKTKSKHIPSEMKFQGNTSDEPEVVANYFNNLFYSNFTHVHNTDNLPPINSFINPNLSIVQLSVAEVRIILQNIDTSKATGPDGIPGVFLKNCAKELAPSFTKLLNISLQAGIFPNSWKMANICPIFKKGDRTNCENYRPISLLSILSKIFERAICNIIYPEIKDLISNNQYGFVQRRSTESQLYVFYDKISKILDSGGQTDVIYLDFTKAFDSVPHHLLIHKLQTFGFNGTLLNWFHSYLNNRYQRVLIHGSMSTKLPVRSGVPQGSILGPLMFILYVNDIADNI